jgi:hypothetical protein
MRRICASSPSGGRKPVVDWLIANEVPSERLFRLPARLVAADGRSEAAPGRESRVVLSLK